MSKLKRTIGTFSRNAWRRREQQIAPTADSSKRPVVGSGTADTDEPAPSDPYSTVPDTTPVAVPYVNDRSWAPPIVKAWPRLIEAPVANVELPCRYHSTRSFAVPGPPPPVVPKAFRNALYPAEPLMLSLRHFT